MVFSGCLDGIVIPHACAKGKAIGRICCLLSRKSPDLVTNQSESVNYALSRKKNENLNNSWGFGSTWGHTFIWV